MNILRNFEDWYDNLQEPYRLLAVVIMILGWDLPIAFGMSIGSLPLIAIGFAWLTTMLIWGFWRNL